VQYLTSGNSVNVTVGKVWESGRSIGSPSSGVSLVIDSNKFTKALVSGSVICW